MVSIVRFIEKKQRWLSIAMVLFMSCAATYLTVVQPYFLDRIELKTMDARFHWRGSITPDPRVVVVAVDDQSISTVGRWPWPRDKISTLIDRVVGEYGAAVLGMDVVFSEEQNNPLMESMRLMKNAEKTNPLVDQWLLKQRETGNLDAQFSSMLEKYHDRVVLGYFFYPFGATAPSLEKARIQRDADLLLPSAINASVSSPEALRKLPGIQAVEINLPDIMGATDTAGFFNFFPDKDGMVRRVPLVVHLGEDVYPSLDLQMLRIALGWPDISITVTEGGVESLFMGERKINTDPSGRMLINHYGSGNTFQYISAMDILENKVDPAIFKDAIVLLGVTAKAVYDLRPNPFDTVLPGVEDHAAVLSNILNNQEIHRSALLDISELLIVFMLSLICGLLAINRSPAVQGSMLIFIPLLIVAAALFFFFEYYLWIKETYLILGVLMTILPTSLFEYVMESRQRAFIHNAFSHYLSSDVVEELAEHPELLKLGGEERVITAFFSDIAAFSSFSEHLTPQKLVDFLNQYLGEMSDIIMRNGGTIDKYEGDAIIAFFGAPLDMPDHAVQCTLSAIEQQNALAQLREKWRAEGHPDIYVRMGINSGPIVVGNMGTSTRMDYTMMGDHVNLASRLEGVNKVYGTPTLVSGDTQAMIGDKIVSRFIDRVQVVGRKTPVDIYQPLGLKEDVSESELSIDHDYKAAWTLMQQHDFVAASQQFTQLLEHDPNDSSAAVMLQRVNHFIQNAPESDWNGVHVLSSK